MYMYVQYVFHCIILTSSAQLEAGGSATGPKALVSLLSYLPLILSIVFDLLF